MVDAWPTSLPKRFNLDGLTNQPGDGRIRTSPETGPALVRGRTSAIVDTITGNMKMTTAQWSALQTFGKTTLLNWSLPFTFPDIDYGAEDLLVRFGDTLPSRTQLAPGTWNVSLALEKLP